MECANIMDEKKNLKKKHALASKGYVGPIIIGIVGQFLVISLLSGMVSDFLPDSFDEYHIVDIILSILVLLFFKFSFRDEYEGSLGISNWDNKLWIAIAAIVIVDLVSVTVFGEFSLSNFTLKGLGLAISAGLNEETFYRVIPVALMLRNKNSKENIVKIAIISSAVFGLIHLPNMFMGAEVSTTILQVFTSAVSGLFYGSMFMYTGSLIPPVLLHALHDLMCFMDPTAGSTDGTAAVEMTTGVIVLEVITIIIKIVIAVCILRPELREKIEEIWNKKWKKSKVAAQ